MIKKMISSEEQRKKRKRNSLIIGIVLILVMFGSVFGILINSFGGAGSSNQGGEEKITYQGYEFINQNGLWTTSVGGFNFIFTYLPQQTINITTSVKDFSTYTGKPLYVYSESIEAEAEIYRNLLDVAERVQRACFSKDKCDGDYPIKTCADNFIIVQEKSREELKQTENCVYISGEKENLIKLTDEFLFKSIGIKQ